MQSVAPASKVRFGSTYKPRIITPHCCIAERLARPLPLNDRRYNFGFAPTSVAWPEGYAGFHHGRSRPEEIRRQNHVRGTCSRVREVGLFFRSRGKLPANSHSSLNKKVSKFNRNAKLKALTGSAELNAAPVHSFSLIMGASELPCRVLRF